MLLSISTTTNACWLREQVPDTNYITSDTAVIQRITGYAGHMAGIFDFSALPAAANIYLAKIYLLLNQAPSGAAAGKNIDVFRVLQALNVNQMTWNIYATGLSWNVAGAGAEGVDFTAALSASAVLPATATWVAVNVTDMVKYAQVNCSKILKCVIKPATNWATSSDSITVVASAGTGKPRLDLLYSYGGRNKIQIF